MASGYCTSCAHVGKMRHFPYLMSAPCAHFYALIYFTTVTSLGLSAAKKRVNVCVGGLKRERKGKEPMADFRMMHIVYSSKHLEYNSLRNEDHMTQLDMVPF